MGESGKPESLDLLIGALDDNNWYVIKYAVQSLGQIGGSKAEEALVQMVIREPSKDSKPFWSEIIKSLCDAFDLSPSKKALPDLEKLAKKEKNKEVKKRLVKTINTIRLAP